MPAAIPNLMKDTENDLMMPLKRIFFFVSARNFLILSPTANLYNNFWMK
jgi:hypothetical protein